MEKVFLLVALAGFMWFFLAFVLWIVRGIRSGVTSRRLWAASAGCAWMGVASYVFARGDGIESFWLIAALMGFVYLCTKALPSLHKPLTSWSLANSGVGPGIDSRQKENSRWELKSTLAILFMFIVAFYANQVLFKFLLMLTGAILTVRGVDWLSGGFKHRVVSRIYLAVALACAFGGLTIYAMVAEPCMTHSQFDPLCANAKSGWAGMLFIGIVLSFCLGLFLRGVLEVVFSGSRSSAGNNWRNAGDRDSDPDNYISASNPSHD